MHICLQKCKVVSEILLFLVIKFLRYIVEYIIFKLILLVSPLHEKHEIFFNNLKFNFQSKILKINKNIDKTVLFSNNLCQFLILIHLRKIICIPVNFKDQMMTNEDTIAHFKIRAPVKDTSLSPVINISHNEVDTMFFSLYISTRPIQIIKICNSQ